MKKYGFQYKIFKILILLVSVTALVLTVIFGHYIKRLSVEAMVERYANRNRQLYDVFLNYYDKIDRNMDNFIVNEAVQRSLTGAETGAMEKEKVVRALSFLGDETDYYLYVDNKNVLYTQGSVLRDAQEIRDSWTALLGDSYAETKLVRVEDTLFGNGEMRLFACRYIRPMNQSHEPGILITRMNQETLSASFAQFGEEKAGCCILDSQNRICFTFGAQEKEGTWEGIIKKLEGQDFSGRSFNTVSRREGLVSVCQDEDSGFFVVSHVGYGTLMGTYYQTLLIVVLVFALILVCVLLVSLKVSGWIARPVQKISRHMTEFGDQNMGNYLELHTDTELDSIGNAYNQMLDTIQSLMDAVKFREKELRKSEMNSLMYQINPHFLYNTLDVIYMLARIHQEKEIMQMIQALTKLLRINLSHGADTILLKDELAYVKAYMDIMKIRNDNLFTYEIECGPELLELPVMKLLLQPLVENAIKHGFKRISEGGRILIFVDQADGYLRFAVKNNGELIAPEKAEQINRSALEPLTAGKEGRKGPAGPPVSAVAQEQTAAGAGTAQGPTAAGAGTAQGQTAARESTAQEQTAARGSTAQAQTAVRESTAQAPTTARGDAAREQGGYGVANVITRIRLRYLDRVRFYFAIEEGYTVCHIDISMEALTDET